MGDEENPGLEALLECAEQVTITIRNYMKDIAGFLRKKKVIDLSLYTQVTDPRAREPIDDRARLVYQRLQAMVEQDEKYYELFVDFLRKSPQKYGKTLSMLDKVYADNGGVATNDSGSTASGASQQLAAPAATTSHPPQESRRVVDVQPHYKAKKIELLKVQSALEDVPISRHTALGVALGVDLKRIQIFEKNFQGDVERVWMEVIQYWIDNSPTPTWLSLAQILLENGFPQVASKIAILE